MKTVVAALAGTAGSGTAILGERVASILNWPFASFGSYVRAVAAHRGLQGSRKELQDVGLQLLEDVDGFCRAVIAQSRWRPGQSLVVDGLRHEEVLRALSQQLSPTNVTEIYVSADIPTREMRLRERGEVPPGGTPAIDSHPVEQQVITRLAQNAQMTIDGRLPEEQQIDQLVEAMIRAAEIPPHHAWLTRENLVRIPSDIRQKLKLDIGDRIELESFDRLFLGFKVVDEDRIQSVFGRLEKEMAGVDPGEWVATLRGRSTLSAD
jgi:cytidylate kinase